MFWSDLHGILYSFISEKELDRISEVALKKDEEKEVRGESGRPNFCKFVEEHVTNVEEFFNKSINTSFLVPCSSQEGNERSKNKDDLCKVFRYNIFTFHLMK